MIVGFTINDFNGHEEDAIRFIQEVCILEDPQIAKNIVEAGTGVNIYSNALHSEILSSLPFRVTPIELEAGKYILVSIVNFNLELLQAGGGFWYHKGIFQQDRKWKNEAVKGTSGNSA